MRTPSQLDSKLLEVGSYVPHLLASHHLRQCLHIIGIGVICLIVISSIHLVRT